MSAILVKSYVGQAEAYFEKELSNERETYYTEKGTSVGQWAGKGAEALGLKGDINKEDFSQMSRGVNPATGKRFRRIILSRTREAGGEVKLVKEIAGWDMVISAPKSVSIAGLIGQDGRVIIAHEESVTDALERAEQQAQANLGGGKKKQTNNLIVGRFKHDSARPSKSGFVAPQLHDHCFIMNATLRAKGTIKPLETLELHRGQSYIKSVYYTALADRLQKLGYLLEIDKETGAPEIIGISKEYRAACSPRRAEILELAVKAGKNYRQLGLVNRREKIFDPNLIQEQHRGIDGLFDYQALRVVQAAEKNPRPAGDTGTSGVEQAKAAVTSALAKISARETVFNPRVVLLEANKRGVGQTTVATIEAEFETRKTDGQIKIVRLGDGREAAFLSVDEKTERPQEPLLIEILSPKETFKAEFFRSFSSADKDVLLEKEFAELTFEQKDSVVSILDAETGVTTLKDDAGTAKTKTLSIINKIAEKVEYEVLGVSPAGGGALQEFNKAGIKTTTLQKLLASKDTPRERQRFYIVDESSFVSSRQMDKFFREAVKPGDRVLLAGDTPRRKESEKPRAQTGDEQTGNGAKVASSGRQSKKVARATIEHPPEEKIAEAVEAMRRRGQVFEIEDRHDRLAVIVETFIEEPEKSLVVAPQSADRRAINRKIHELLKDAGRVGREEIEIKILRPREELSGIERISAAAYRKGDVITYTRGSAENKIAAHNVARVIATDDERNLLTVEIKDQRDGTEVREVIYNPKRLRGVSVWAEEKIKVSEGERLQFRALSGEKKTKIVSGTMLEVGKISADALNLTTVEGKAFKLDLSRPHVIDYGYAVGSPNLQEKATDRILVHAETKESNQILNQRMAHIALRRDREQDLIFTDNAGQLARKLNQPDETVLVTPGKSHLNSFQAQAAALRDKPLSDYWWKMKAEVSGQGQVTVNPAAFEFLRVGYKETFRNDVDNFENLLDEKETADKFLRTLVYKEQRAGIYEESIASINKIIAEGRQTLGNGSLILLAGEKIAPHQAVQLAVNFDPPKKNLVEQKQPDQTYAEFQLVFKQAGLEKLLDSKNGTAKFETAGSNPKRYEIVFSNDEIKFYKVKNTDDRIDPKTENHSITFRRDEAGNYQPAESFRLPDGIHPEAAAGYVKDNALEKISLLKTSELGKNIIVTRLDIENASKAEIEEANRANLKKYVSRQLGAELVAEITVTAAKYEENRFHNNISNERLKVNADIGRGVESREISRADLLCEREAMARSNVHKLREQGTLAGRVEDESISIEADEKRQHSNEIIRIQAMQRPWTDALDKAIASETARLEEVTAQANLQLKAEMAETDSIIKQTGIKNTKQIKPVISAEKVWIEQIKAVKRFDTDTFVKLEEIHQANSLPRPNDAYARLRGMETVTRLNVRWEKTALVEQFGKPAAEKNIVINLRRENGELKLEAWREQKTEPPSKQLTVEVQGENSEVKAGQTSLSINAPCLLTEKINPVLSAKTDLSWIADNKKTLNPYLNPVGVIKNDEGLQIVRAVAGYIDQKSKNEQLADLTEKVVSAAQISRTCSTSEAADNAARLNEAVRSAVQREEAMRENFRFDESLNTDLLKTPESRLKWAELKQIGVIAAETGDVQYVKEYCDLVKKDIEVAGLVGESEQRIVAEFFLAEARAASRAKNAIELITPLPDGSINVELNAAQLAQAIDSFRAADAFEEFQPAKSDQLLITTLSLDDINQVERFLAANNKLADQLNDQIINIGNHLMKNLQPPEQELIVLQPAIQKKEQVIIKDASKLEAAPLTSKSSSAVNRDEIFRETLANPEVTNEESKRQNIIAARIQPLAVTKTVSVPGSQNNLDNGAKISEREVNHLSQANNVEISEEAKSLNAESNSSINSTVKPHQLKEIVAENNPIPPLIKLSQAKENEIREAERKFNDELALHIKEKSPNRG